MSGLAASFGRAAGTYLAHAQVQKALAEWLSEWLPARRLGRALEIGAGPGVFTRLIFPWGGPVTASDFSPDMCEAGRKAVPGANWLVAPAEEPPEGPWDWIFTSGMLQWTADPVRAFSAWRARLAPGGRILAGLFVDGSLPEWTAVAGGLSPLTWRTAEEWRTFLESAGLRVVRDGTQQRVFTHASARAFLRSLHRVGAAPARLVPAPRLRHLLCDYETRHKVPGGVPATWIFHRLEALPAG